MKECLDSLRSVLSCELKTSIQEVNNTVNDSDGKDKNNLFCYVISNGIHRLA